MSKQFSGNTVAEAADYAKMLARLANTLLAAERVFDRYFDEDVFIESLKFRLPQYDGQEYLAVVQARTGDGAVVAFHNADTLAEAVRGVLSRLDNRSLKFKEDQYRNDG